MNSVVLAETVAEWRRVCAGEGGGGPVRVRRALGTEGTAVEARCRGRALAALERGFRPEARRLALRACTLHRSHDSVVVRAAVALADGDFPLALRLWREIRQGRET